MAQPTKLTDVWNPPKQTATPNLPKTMKAAYRSTFGPLDKTLKITDLPLPKQATSLPSNHILVKIAYTSLNPLDYKLPENPLLGRLVFKGIPCLDFAGSVVTSNSPNFQQGDTVFGQTQPPAFGACAEHAVVAAENCVHVPDGVELKDASTIGIAALTAYQTIIPFVPTGGGGKVFINGGSGGVGTFAIQIAKAVGCSVTTSCSGANAELCRSLGADEVIDYRTQNVASTLKRSGKQFDLIVDNVLADPGLYWASHAYLKPAGRFVTIAGEFNFGFFRNFVSMMLLPSFLGGGQRKFQFVGRVTRTEEYERIARWVQDGSVRVVIEETFPLEEVGRAFERLKTGRARGKLVVQVS